MVGGGADSLDWLSFLKNGFFESLLYDDVCDKEGAAGAARGLASVDGVFDFDASDDGVPNAGACGNGICSGLGGVTASLERN